MKNDIRTMSKKDLDDMNDRARGFHEKEQRDKLNTRLSTRKRPPIDWNDVGIPALNEEEISYTEDCES